MQIDYSNTVQMGTGLFNASTSTQITLIAGPSRCRPVSSQIY